MAATALNGQLPQHIASTGGLLNSAETEEKYAITWTSKTEQAFELPTGGAALMNSGENLMYFARKEQCLALGTQLRTKFKPRIEDYKIYRIYPGGEGCFKICGPTLSQRNQVGATANSLMKGVAIGTEHDLIIAAGTRRS